MANTITDRRVITKIGKNELLQMGVAIEEGEALALSYIHDIMIFNIPSAHFFYQNIVNLAIDYTLEEKCKNGIIDYDYHYNYNYSNNCKHIELVKKDLIITHSSGNHRDFPRKAKYREKLCSNQLSLFEEVNTEIMYCILMHSSQLKQGCKPKIAIGVPDSTCQRWCSYIPLNAISDIVPLNITPVEQKQPDIEKFKFVMKDRLEELNRIG